MSFVSGLGILSAVLGILFVLLCVVLGVCTVVTIVAKWKVYKKCGKQGWEAIIPFYTDYVLCEITSLEWWFFLIMNAVVICNILFLGVLSGAATVAALGASFFANYNLARKFGKEPVGYGIGLTLLPFVFYSILGFGSAMPSDKEELSAFGPFTDTREKTKTKKNTTKDSKCPNCKNSIQKDTKYCPNCGVKID